MCVYVCEGICVWVCVGMRVCVYACMRVSDGCTHVGCTCAGCTGAGMCTSAKVYSVCKIIRVSGCTNR